MSLTLSVRVEIAVAIAVPVNRRIRLPTRKAAAYSVQLSVSTHGLASPLVDDFLRRGQAMAPENGNLMTCLPLCHCFSKHRRKKLSGSVERQRFLATTHLPAAGLGGEAASFVHVVLVDHERAPGLRFH